MQCKYSYDIEKIPCTGLRRLEEAGSAHEPELLHRVHREPREEQLRQPEDAAETVELRQAGVLQRQEPQEGPRRRGSAPHVVVDQSDDAEGVPAGCVEEGGRAERQDGHQELLQQVLQRGQVILVSYWSGHHNTPLSLVNV